MNFSKSEILNPESGDIATVKFDLVETYIIQENKNYVEGQGVLLSSFSSPARSDTTIPVKTSHMEQPLIKFLNLVASIGASSWFNSGCRIQETGWSCERILYGCVSPVW